MREIYSETVNCLNNKDLILCAAGIRALVEGLCKANNINDGEVEVVRNGTIIKRRESNLQGKINGLYEQGKLTKNNADTLHEHRFLGNSAIHDLSVPDEDALRLALQIIEHVYDTIYEIPEKADLLRNRRTGNLPF